MYPEAFVYFVREGKNQELRYSMRSVARHFPDVPVAIVGDKPDWCAPNAFLRGNRAGSKTGNVWDNVRLISEWDELPQNVVIMNDDMFITGPVEDVPLLYRGSLAQHIATVAHRDDWWSRSLEATFMILGNFSLSYELHTPFPVIRNVLAAALELPDWFKGELPQWRTLYGNRANLPAERAVKDCKRDKRNDRDVPVPFLSTDDLSFRRTYHQLMHRLYPVRSPWERER